MVKSKCPNCGELDEIEQNEFNVFCRFCGVPYQPREGIEAYENHISSITRSLSVDTVNLHNENLKNYALLGLTALKEGNREKCGFYAEDILKRDSASPEGLLLKAFFVSNNYSKEEGIDNYLRALNFASEELSQLIIDTFKKDILEYGKENYHYLIEKLLSNNSLSNQKLLSFALMSYYFENEESIIDLTMLTSYFSDKKEISKSIIVVDNLICQIYENNIITLFDINSIKKEVEKYFNKKNDKSIAYYFHYDDNHIISFNLNEEDLEFESFLINDNFNITNIKGGCYVASCVYGSYHAKEVYTLRRFRDECLKNSFFGRLFIKTYYFLSPILLKLFSNKKWFNSFSQTWLNKFVNYLNKKGYSSLPYKDK